MKEFWPGYHVTLETGDSGELSDGTILIAKQPMKLTAPARLSDMPQEQRKDFYTYRERKDKR